MCSSNFDWSIEIMDPGRSGLHKKNTRRPREQIGLPVDNWPLTTRARVTFDIQRAFRTFNVSMAVWSRFFPNFRSELARKKIFLANVIPQ